MIRFETKTEPQTTKYVVVKDFWIPESSIKFVLMFWLFCAVVFATYVFAQVDAQNNLMITAYLSQGSLINATSGEPMYCRPILENKNIRWECGTGNTTMKNTG